MYKRKRAGNTITRKINSTKDTAAKADKNHYISNSYLEGFIPIDTEYFTASEKMVMNIFLFAGIILLTILMAALLFYKKLFRPLELLLVDAFGQIKKSKGCSNLSTVTTTIAFNVPDEVSTIAPIGTRIIFSASLHRIFPKI